MCVPLFLELCMHAVGARPESEMLDSKSARFAPEDEFADGAWRVFVELLKCLHSDR